jgi:DeoR family fructose operon transcriptional repressor
MIESASELAIVTNGLTTFQAVKGRSGVRAYLTGGESEERNESLVGSLAVTAVSGFVFARSFMSTTCVDPDIGTSEPTTIEVEVKRAMADASKHVVLAADSSKLGTQSVVRALAISRIHVLATELDPHDGRLDPYRDLVELL